MIKRYLEKRQSILLQLTFHRIWSSWLSTVLYLDCVWNHRRARSKSRLKIALQSSICCTALEFSLPNLSMSLLYALSGWSASYHLFRVLLWGLPRVAYREAVATSLMEFCSFFSISFGYISYPLHDINISSIFLFGVEECSIGAVCGEHLGLTIKPPKHRLDVVLVSLLVALDGFHALYWCSVVDFEQIFG